jgi:hypothetical protein
MIRQGFVVTTFLGASTLLALSAGCGGTITLKTCDDSALVDLVNWKQFRMDFVEASGGRWVLSNKGVVFDEKRSTFRSGSQRSGVTHRGDALLLTRSVTIVLAGDPASPESIHPTAPDSGSTVWVEPGEFASQIVITTDASSIPDASLKTVGIAREELPPLSLEVWASGTGNELILLLGSGTRYWGATKGGVVIGGRERRNMKDVRIQHTSANDAKVEPLDKRRPSFLEYK